MRELERVMENVTMEDLCDLMCGAPEEDEEYEEEFEEEEQ